MNRLTGKTLIHQTFKFIAMQYRIGRRIMRGKFYLVQPNLPIGPFWTNSIITSCQTRILKSEHYTPKNYGSKGA